MKAFPFLSRAAAPAGPAARADAAYRRTRARLLLGGAVFALAFSILGARLSMLGVQSAIAADPPLVGSDAPARARPDIVDRAGQVMATDIRSVSLFAEPKNIIDPDEATELITGVLPGLDAAKLRRQLDTKAGFVWVKRQITRDQQGAIHRLGIPGVGFRTEPKRFYPGGPTAGHVLGAVNIDNLGIAGIEKHIDGSGLLALQDAGLAASTALEPFQLGVDMRVQHVVRDEVAKAVERYHAIAGVGIVMDVRTGEVLSMSSLPDYDPNVPAEALDKDRMNRASAGLFEMGSTFKGFTTAMALDSGQVSLGSSFDARGGLYVGKFRISDFHGKNRVLTVPEIFIYSSNIGTAKMALSVGGEAHREFLKKVGLLTPLRTELPETATPTFPRGQWSKISQVTISFGHGISVTPLQTAVAGAALVNGGLLVPPTFLPRTEEEARTLATRVLSEETSAAMRGMFRLNTLKGSGKRANTPGFRVGGKTGTAEKVVAGRYSKDKRRNAFLAAFPMDNPRYLVLVVLDEPKPEKPGMGATAGSNAAVAVGEIVRRAAPLLGVEPRFDTEGDLVAPLPGKAAKAGH